MAIYSLNHKSVGRATHAPGTASAHIAYITRPRAASEIIAEHMPEKQGEAMRWMDEQEAGSRKNARLIDKVMVALPRELDAQQRAELVRTFASAVTQDRVPWIAATHDMGKDAQNPHAHIAFRDRDRETGQRVLRLSDSERDRTKAGLEPNGTEWLRQVWERCANEALERAGRSERIDRRSLEAQGLERDPGIHVGPKANELAKKDAVPPSRVANDNNGREIRWPEIDEGRSRVEHNRSIGAKNRLRDVKLDRFKQEVGKAWDELVRQQQQDTRDDLWRLAEAEKRERRKLEKRQTFRMAEEAAADNAKRPTGIRSLFARLTGRAKRIEKEIAQAKSRRTFRDKAEWKALDERQAEERRVQERYRKERYDQEKQHFRVEAKRLHARVLAEANRAPVKVKDRGKAPDMQRTREEDDDRSGRGKHLRP